jgi:hypothetical protein
MCGVDDVHDIHISAGVPQSLDKHAENHLKRGEENNDGWRLIVI